VTTRYIHTCYRILDPEKSTDFYVNKLGMKKIGEMHFDTATNYFFAMAEEASEPMLELTHNHDRAEPYDMGDGYAHVAFVVDDLEGTVGRLQEQGVEVAVEPKTMSVGGHDYRIAFVVDPDGYRVELVERGTMKVGDIIQ
jgi:lactoylglutathione lyase